MHYSRQWRHGDPSVLLRQLDWDSVYVVTSDEVVKFGVSASIDTRLADHARNGLTNRQRLVQGLPVGVAKWTEDQLIDVLRTSGATPLGNSREYFPIEWCDFIVSAFDRLVP